METYEYLNPLWWYKSIKEGTLVDHVDKRVASAILFLFGVKALCTFGLRPLGFFYRHAIRPRKNLHARYGGGWAVITGASDGIGLAFSKQLAAQGFNILMISRSEAKLEVAKKEVEAINSKVKVKTLEFNLNRPFTHDGYRPLFYAIAELSDVSILINNVGHGNTPQWEYHLTSPDENCSLVQLNINPVVFLTRHILGYFVDRKSRSAVINVSSLAGNSGFPLLPTYGGTKAFVNNFTDAISQVPHYKKVDFLNLTPGVVKTNLNPGNVYFTVEADDFAKQSLAKLGYERASNGTWQHDVFQVLADTPVIQIPLMMHLMNDLKNWGTDVEQEAA